MVKFLKVFESFRNYFIEHFTNKIEKYPSCVDCNKILTGRQRKFCSVECSNKYWNNIHKKPYFNKLKGGKK